MFQSDKFFEYPKHIIKTSISKRCIWFRGTYLQLQMKRGILKDYWKNTLKTCENNEHHKY